MAGQGSCATGAAACIAVDQALAFVDGALAPAERAMVEHRIDACAACRATVAAAARGAGGELVRDPAGRSAVQRAAVTSPSRRPRGPAGGGPTPPGEPRPAPPAAAHAVLSSGLAPGEVVGRYVVERPLGAGGMGVVSLARDPELRRAVVIKLVHPNMGHGEGGDELEARLRREAQAMAQVSHTNVVQIFDIGRRGDRVFLAMEFIAGHTLDAWLRERPRSLDEILGVIRQAGAGLAAAHRAGLVHRDFKPANVLVGADGIVKVTDFGLARSVSASGPRLVSATRRLRVPAAGAPGPRPSGVHAVLTEANAVVGTPAYMAPEQAAGEPIDARTDQYALAVTLLDALLGQDPTQRVVSPMDPPLAIDAALGRAGIALPLRAATLRALADDPAARFPSIDGFLGALAAPSAPPARPRSRRTAWVLAAVALSGTAAAVAIAVTRRVTGDDAGCMAQAPQRWNRESRARAIAALAAAPRAFSGWDAERVAAAIDGAVDSLATAERGRCSGAPVAGPAGSAECVARRTQALGAALAAFAASPPEDPWRWVRAIEACDAVADTAALRDELRGASLERARAIAAEASRGGDERLAADARARAGLVALGAGDAAAAEAELLAMKSAGERLGDDAIRGRALLQLLETARWRGDHATARRELDELDAMVARHHDAPRDQLTVALVAAGAFTDLGDVATAFASWERARALAGSLGDRDRALTAAIGRAWATYALRLDPAAARAEAATALAAGQAASPAVRAEALGIAAELALAARDGAAARTALAEAHRLVPDRANQVVDRVRGERARALLGELDDALGALAPAASEDALTAARLEIARGKILLDAARPAEARAVLESVELDLRGYGKRRKPAAMPAIERLDLELTTCAAQLAEAERCRASYQIEALLEDLHARAPARARFAIAEAATESMRSLSSLRARRLMSALDLLIAAHAAPVPIAELQWQVAQLGADGPDHVGLASKARDALRAAGRADTVREIDAWLATRSPGAGQAGGTAIAPPAAPPARRDPWGPQP